MSDKIRKVLTVGLEEGFLRRLEPMLVDAGFDVDVLIRMDAALAIAGVVAIDILVVGYPIAGGTLQKCVSTIRETGSPCRRSAVLVVARPADLPEVSGFDDGGYLRCLATDIDEQTMRAEVDRLTRFAPRLSVRIPIRIEAHLGSEKALVLSQTENVSACGMLVKVWRRLNEETELDFELMIPGERLPVRGRGEVVRHTSDWAGNVHGAGIRFVRFEGEGQEVLRYYLRWKSLP